MSLFMIAVAVAVTLTMASGYVLFVAMAVFSVFVMPFVAFFAYIEYVRMKNLTLLQQEWDDRLRQDPVLFIDETDTLVDVETVIDVTAYNPYIPNQDVLEDVG